MEFFIRPFQEQDAESIALMAAKLSAHEGMPPPPFGAGDVLRFGFGAGKRFDGLVAVMQTDGADNGGLIGYTLFIDSFNIGLGAAGTDMLDLFVEDRARGSGAGRALLAAVAATTLARGGSWLSWQCLPTNKSAVDFYYHVGGQQYLAADFELSGERLTTLAAKSDIMQGNMV